MKQKLIAVIMAFALTFSVVGCNKKPVQPETPVVQLERTLLAAADATAIVASGLQTVDEVRKSFSKNGEIDAVQDAAILSFLKKVAAKNEAAVQAIKLAQTAGDSVAADKIWHQALMDVVVEWRTDIDPAFFGIKSANAQATMKAALATVELTITYIQATFGQAPAPIPTPAPAVQ